MTRYKHAFIFVCLALLNACSGITGKQSSVILVTVENLSGVDFSCNSYGEEEKSGFQILCEEGVRFTHAYVPSILSQSTMASILTGQHPVAHGVRDNGSTFLSAKTKTTVEYLTEKEIKSVFIVSAPTIKRYSRLHQGFEIFDDNLNMHINKSYRTAMEVVDIFRDWYLEDASGSQFFSVLHLSDLLFPLSVTKNNLGESRPLGLESQMEEIDESLFELFGMLKTKKLWDKNYIILTGLNGTSNSDRINETPVTNLFSENSSVVLFVKPPKGREETPHNWKIDEIVSLMDLGATIKDIFAVKENGNNEKIETEWDELFVGQSLLPFVLLNKNQISRERALLIESAWPRWAGMGEIRYSVRKNQWLYINDEKAKLYNTLIDRAESVPVSDKDISAVGFIEDVHEILDLINAEPWRPIDRELREALALINQLRVSIKYQNEDWSADILRLAREESKISVLKFWLVEMLAKTGKWERINEFNLIWNDPLIREYYEVAKGKKKVEHNDPCLNYLFRNNSSSNVKKFCSSEDFISIADYLLSEESAREEAHNRFLARYQFSRTKVFFAGLDVILGGSLMALEAAKSSDHLLIDLVSMLPQFQKNMADPKELSKVK
jgi:hypothetical protein